MTRLTCSYFLSYFPFLNSSIRRAKLLYDLCHHQDIEFIPFKPLYRGIRYYKTFLDSDYEPHPVWKPPSIPILTQDYPPLLAYAPFPSSIPESLPFFQPSAPIHAFSQKNLSLSVTHPVVSHPTGEIFLPLQKKPPKKIIEKKDEKKKTKTYSKSLRIDTILNHGYT